MSTKIYNAFKFNGKPSELMEHLRDYRPIWHHFQVRRLCAEPPEFSSYLAFVDGIKLQSKKSYPSYDDIYDVRGSVAIYFHKRNIYIQTFLQ